VIVLLQLHTENDMNELNVLRRTLLKGGCAAGVVAFAASAGLLVPGRALAAQWNKAAFESKSVADALKGLGAAGVTDSKEILIKAPDIAENGTVVPVEVTSLIAGTQSISIQGEKNRGSQGGWQTLQRGQGNQGHHRRLRRLRFEILNKERNRKWQNQ
jgi:sulfur-oxidizing protein SoxY